jgi:YHS domain-containing protein
MRHCLLLLLFISAFAIQAQDYVEEDTTRNAPRTDRKDPRPFKDRIWFGGGIGLSFGTVTAIQVDPMIGYKVDQKGKFSVGLGGSYWYFNDNRFDANFSAYGYRIFSRYRVIQPLYAHVEFLHMNLEGQELFTLERQRIWVPHLLVGAGYVQQLAGRSSVFIQVLFDVLQDPNSIYRDTGPIFMGGVGIGF